MPRIWRVQYSGEASSSAVASSPVTVETSGMRGAWKGSPAATSRNSSSTGSMCAEWNAWLTVRRRVRRPSSAKCAATPATSASSPETTTDRGPFTAANETPGVSSGSTSSSVASTAVIAPPAGARCINRPRAATSDAASSSDSTPATCAAVTSPIECPATHRGSSP